MGHVQANTGCTQIHRNVNINPSGSVIQSGLCIYARRNLKVTVVITVRLRQGA
jgi:hypothetical protein